MLRPNSQPALPFPVGLYLQPHLTLLSVEQTQSADSELPTCSETACYTHAEQGAVAM